MSSELRGSTRLCTADCSALPAHGARERAAPVPSAHGASLLTALRPEALPGNSAGCETAERRWNAVPLAAGAMGSCLET